MRCYKGDDGHPDEEDIVGEAQGKESVATKEKRK